MTRRLRYYADVSYLIDGDDHLPLGRRLGLAFLRGPFQRPRRWFCLCDCVIVLLFVSAEHGTFVWGAQPGLDPCVR